MKSSALPSQKAKPVPLKNQQHRALQYGARLGKGVPVAGGGCLWPGDALCLR